MKCFLTWVAVIAFLFFHSARISALPAQTNVKADRTVEQRLQDLEAYVNNDARNADTNSASKIPGPGPGHNGFQMICAALVLFMTLPGLALFYGGLVRSKHVLSILAQCFGIAGLVSILWWVCGYSIAFHPNGSGFWGGLDWKFLNGVDSQPNADYSQWVSHNVYCMYQLMFAIITPALIIGAIAERMKFSALLLFVGIWMFLVYFPLAHMVWGADGLMNGSGNANARIRALDFAGGTVVHMSSGWSALVLCLILGKRVGFGREPMPPHNLVLCMVGTGMLWVGWYGFNAGSAVGADGIAATAFMNTTMAAAVASFVWAMAEYLLRGKPSVLGFCSGAVAGLVVITPACGFVDVNGAVIIGIVAGLVPFLAVWKLKAALGFDDALDTFGVHGVGGTLGALLTGFLATDKVNRNLQTIADPNSANAATKNGLAKLLANHMAWVEQLKAIGITIGMSVVATLVIAYALKAMLGLRVSREIETAGLDLAEHGEEGYHSVN